MTKKERLLKAFNNEKVDKVPFGFWYHFSPDDDFGPETVAEHLKFYKDTDMDMIKVMCDGYFNYPNPYIQKVTCPEDWFDLTPLGANHPYITKQVERAKGVVEGVNGECCVFYNVFCAGCVYPRNVGKKRKGSCVKVDTYTVNAVFNHASECFVKAGRLHVVLILSDADGTGLDFYKLGKRILNTACNGHRTSLGYVKIGKFLCRKGGSGINRCTCLRGDYVFYRKRMIFYHV